MRLNRFIPILLAGLFIINAACSSLTPKQERATEIAGLYASIQVRQPGHDPDADELKEEIMKSAASLVKNCKPLPHGDTVFAFEYDESCGRTLRSYGTEMMLAYIDGDCRADTFPGLFIFCNESSAVLQVLFPRPAEISKK